MRRLLAFTRGHGQSAALITALASALASLPTESSALGGVVTIEGEAATFDASRTFLVRGAETVQRVTQLRYDGSPTAFAWVLPIPDANPDDGVVINTSFGQEAFDALEAATLPAFEGQCDGAPNGESTSFQFRESFGPMPPEAPGPRIFRRAARAAAKTYITAPLG